MCLISSQCRTLASEAASGSSSETAAAILLSLGERDYSGATHAVHSALLEFPGNPELVSIQALIELESGRAHVALARLQSATAERPDDSRIRYLLGVAEISVGDTARANADLIEARKIGADETDVRIALNYIEYLKGSLKLTGKAGELPYSEAAIEGMQAASERKWSAALVGLTAAMKAAPGDPVTQSNGPLMSFAKTQPLAVLFPFRSESVETTDLGASAAGGDLLLSPGDVLQGAAFAGYELDGGPLSIVGAKPFSYAWDTRLTSNGLHTITIVLYDAAGVEITRVERKIRVFNRTAIKHIAPGDGDRQLDADLWRAMMLQPDRAACEYAAGDASLSSGNRNTAGLCFLRAAAIRPDYRDVRQKCAETGVLHTSKRTIYSGRSDAKVVALTFDDGPKPGVTEPLLELLAGAHVRATFFVIGRHMQEYPELARSIAGAGMEIANHSYTHRSLTSLSAIDAEREMLQTEAVVLGQTGKLPEFLRPPGGNWNSRVAASASRWGLTPCMWSVDVFDSEIIGAQKVADTVLRQVKPGSIVLMHNGKVSTLQALPRILRELRARGYQFVTVGELANQQPAKSAMSADSHQVPVRPE